MNKTLQDFARRKLKKGLSKCTPEEQYVFKRMYIQGDLPVTVYDVVDKMPDDKLSWALDQVERTLGKKEPIKEPEEEYFENHDDYLEAEEKFEQEDPWYKLGQLLKELEFQTICGEDDYPEQSELVVDGENFIYMESDSATNMDFINIVCEEVYYLFPLRALTEIKQKVLELKGKIETK